MRKLASIREIKAIHPISGADLIELAQIDGWYIVVQKEKGYKVGDWVVYCEIDSLLPSDNPNFAFMEKYKYRVKTIKLRGVYSQGLIFPLDILPQGIKYQLGEDVTESLGIIKYESPESLVMGDLGGNFLSCVPKTDELRIQNMTEELPIYKSLNDTWIVTEKMDGSSITCSIIDDVFSVCMHNFMTTNDGTNSYSKNAIKLKVEEKIREYLSNHPEYTNLVLQGELLGEGIQKNRQKIKGQTIKFFYIFNPITQKYFEYDEFVAAMNEMDLPMVPVISEDFDIKNHTTDSLLRWADDYAFCELPIMHEGVVIYARHNHYNLININDNIFGRVSFKVVSNAYLGKAE